MSGRIRIKEPEEPPPGERSEVTASLLNAGVKRPDVGMKTNGDSKNHKKSQSTPIQKGRVTAKRNIPNEDSKNHEKNQSTSRQKGRVTAKRNIPNEDSKNHEKSQSTSRQRGRVTAERNIPSSKARCTYVGLGGREVSLAQVCAKLLGCEVKELASELNPTIKDRIKYIKMLASCDRPLEGLEAYKDYCASTRSTIAERSTWSRFVNMLNNEADHLIKMQDSIASAIRKDGEYTVPIAEVLRKMTMERVVRRRNTIERTPTRARTVCVEGKTNRLNDNIRLDDVIHTIGPLITRTSVRKALEDNQLVVFVRQDKKHWGVIIPRAWFRPGKTMTEAVRPAGDTPDQQHDASTGGTNRRQDTQVSDGIRPEPPKEPPPEEGVAPTWELPTARHNTFVWERIEVLRTETGESVLKCKIDQTLPAHTHIIASGIPETSTESIRKRMESHGSNDLLFLKDRRGNNAYCSAKAFNKNLFEGVIVVRRHPDAKGIDAALHVRQSAKPNCVWKGSALVTTRRIEKGEELTTPFDRLTHGISYWSDIQCRLLGMPLIPNLTDDVQTFTSAEIVDMVKITLGAFVHLTRSELRYTSSFENSIEKAIEYGIVPRAESTVMLTAALEMHPVLKYVTDLADRQYKESSKEGLTALKSFVKNRESANADQDLHFKIFEVALRTAIPANGDSLAVQKLCLPLGTTSCVRNPKYLERVIKAMFELLRGLKDVGSVMRKPVVGSILHNLQSIKKNCGMIAVSIMGILLHDANVVQDVTNAVCDLDTQLKQADTLIASVNRDLRMLPITPSEWLKVCEGKNDIQRTHGQDNGWEIHLTHPVPVVPESGIRIACWNVNGLSARMTKDSGFRSFLEQVDPDVLVLSEVKCTSTDLPHSEQTLKGMAHLGYRHIVWNWCTDMINGQPGSRHYGTAVLSKYRLDDIDCGMTTGQDAQGRVITVSLGRATLVCTYVPCARLNGGPEKSFPRGEFDSQLKHYLQRVVQADPERAVFWCGDLNIAPQETDSSLKLNNQAKCPSSTNEERTRHEDTLQGLQFASAGLQLQRSPQPHTWHGSVPLNGPKKAMSRLSMRIDDVITRVDHIGSGEHITPPTITRFDTTKSSFGSDHKAIVWYLSFDGKDIATNKEEDWIVSINGDVNDEQKDIGTTSDATNERKDAVDAIKCDGTTTGTTESQIGATYAPMIHNTSDGMAVHEMLQKLRRKIDELQKKDARIDNEVRASCFAAMRDATVMSRPESYSPYGNDGHRLCRRHDVLPELTLKVEADNGRLREITCLLDSGSHYNIMSYDTVQRLGLKLRKTAECGTQLELPCLTFGDNRTDTVMGCVDVVVHLTKYVKMTINFFVLMSAPYQLFIGSHFMSQQRGVIDYDRGVISIPVGSTTAKIRFQPTKVARDMLLSVSPMCATTIPARTANVRIQVKWDGIPMDMEDQWGILQDSQCHPVVFKTGLTNTHKAHDNDYACYVMATNPTDKPVTITPGKPVCGFHPIDPEEYDVVKSEIFEQEDLTSDEVVFANMNETSHPDLETQWSKYPHIHKIQIADLEEPEEAKQAMMDKLRWMLIRNQEIWNPAPKEVSKNLEEYVIPLDSKPTPCRTRPFNPNTRRQMSELIEKQLAKKIIEPSSSPFSSPVVLVPKKDGRMRFVVDYRNVNKCVTTDRYTTPRVEVALSVLHGNKYYSALDLVDAFWSIPLESKSREITAFQTPNGLYQYRFLPQGLKTSSAVFCRYMDRMIGSLKWTEVLTYVDDILIFSKSFDEHLNSIERVCQAMSKFNMTLAPHKCHLFQESVKYLGHMVDRNGVKCDPDKVKAIREMDIPQTRDDLHSAMCKFRYYRRFVMDYAKIEEPLRKKTLSTAPRWTYDSNSKAEYTEAEREAFETLRNALCNDPVLAHPDWSKEFVLHTDACKTGLGAVLIQMDGDAERVISYASRSLTKTEVNYNQWELECLAMLWASKLLRMYLLGQKYKIVTDSNAAKHIMGLNSENAGGRLLRWSLALQDFDFYIEHRKGKKHANADGLSRLPLSSTQPYNEGETLIEPLGDLDNPGYSTPAAVAVAWKESFPACGAKAFFPPEDKTAFSNKEFVNLQKEDTYCQELNSTGRVKESWDNAKPKQFFKGNGGLIMRKSNDGTHPQTVVPLSLRAFILNRYHGLPVSGHLGSKKVMRQISSHYYWPNMRENVDKWIRACLTCARRKRTRNMAAAEPGRASNATKPWEKIAVDTVTPHEESKDGHTVILTVLDLFTRWVLAIPMKRASGEEVSRALFKHVFCMFGKPKEVISDNGSEFMNTVVQNMLNKWDIRFHYTGGYQPQACPVERYHRFMNNTMTMLCTKHGSDWAEYLPIACFVYNSSTCESTGYTPYELVFCARKPTLLHELDLDYEAERLGLAKPPQDNDNSGSAQAFRQESFNRLHEMYRDVRQSCEKMHLRNKENTLRKEGPSQKKRVRYDVGDQVLFWEPKHKQVMQNEHELKSDRATKRPAKWSEKWSGPHTIVAIEDKVGISYTFFHSEKCVNVTTHANRLCSFQPWSDGIVSTSWEMDARRRYRTGEWVQKGSLVLVPLKKPYPFGIGLMLDCKTNGDMKLQWLGNKNSLPYGTFKTGWIRKNGNVYYSDTPENIRDKPYTTSSEGIEFNQRDVQMHNFELTPTGKIPQPMLRAIAHNPRVWWTPKAVMKELESQEKHRKEQPEQQKESGPAPPIEMPSRKRTRTEGNDVPPRRSARLSQPLLTYVSTGTESTENQDVTIEDVDE